MPKNLQIIELRREFGLGFNVWIVPIREPYKESLANISNRDELWSVPSQAHKMDLVLFHFTHPESYIAHLFILMDRAKKVEAGWKKGEDYMAPIKRICRLKAPIFFEDLKKHRVLSTASFVRGRMQARHNATEYWPYLYDLIIKRNPSLKRRLIKYDPQKL